MTVKKHVSLITLPELDYDYEDLEPAISAEIMSIHHQKHHQAYITNINNALEKYAEAESINDLQTMIALQKAIKFNGGGHINHTIFWKSLAPVSKGGGFMPEGAFKTVFIAKYGSLDDFITNFNNIAVAIQGSGWCWLVWDKKIKCLKIITTSNQDPVNTNEYEPLFGIDVWEHAYYLQYKNARAEYLKNIWQIINWEMVSERYNLVLQKHA